MQVNINQLCFRTPNNTCPCLFAYTCCMPLKNDIADQIIHTAAILGKSMFKLLGYLRGQCWS